MAADAVQQGREVPVPEYFPQKILLKKETILNGIFILIKCLGIIEKLDDILIPWFRGKPVLINQAEKMGFRGIEHAAVWVVFLVYNKR